MVSKMCTFLHVNKFAAKLALVLHEEEWERCGPPAGPREKSSSNEKGTKKIVTSQKWASCSGGVWGSSDGHMRKDQWVGDWSTAGGAPSQFPSASRLNTRFTLMDYYVNAQSLCFQEGKKYSNSQTDVQITLITRLQGFRFNFRSCRHINTDR